MTTVATAFVAYPSRDPALARTIATGVSKANSRLRELRYIPWVFNDVAGAPLVSPILEGIESSQFIVADISYLNPNVVYEAGFAIGKRRRAFLIRHRFTDGDRNIARSAGIFDTLGYEEYDDDEALAHRLSSFVDPTPIQFHINLNRLAPVYVVEPSTKGGIATVLTSRLKKARYQYRSFNPTEDARLSAVDAIRQVAASAGVLLSVQEDDDPAGVIHNIRSAFVAGLAHGMGKPTLILAHSSTALPLDLRDSAKTFGHPNDIADHIAVFSLEITEHLQQTEPVVLNDPNPLQSIQIGDPTAENEMTTLGSYFLTTDQYSRAIRGEVNLVVGRKGAGKTALFLQVRDRVRADKRNIVVDLKPEGYQLLKLKEDILAYVTQGAGQHLITAFWEYVILLEVAYKLLEKDRVSHKFNHEIRDLYIDLEKTYRAGDFSTEGDFSERLLALSLRIAQDYSQRFGAVESTRLTTEQVTEVVYRHDVQSLRERVSAYLQRKQSVWILFDNLDKGWSTQGVDVVDALVLRCLIDAGRKIERDFRKSGLSLHCIVFIRNDVYEFLMQQSADYGKEMRATLDWTDPDMLREMLRLRIAAGLHDVSDGVQFDQLWRILCVSHFAGEESSAYVIERSLMRPRNVIKIFQHARGFASNLNHTKITEDDLRKGILAYSQDLLIELDHELTDVFPAAKDLLYHFIDANAELSSEELVKLVGGAGICGDDVGRICDFLLYYGILGLRADGDVTRYIFDVNYDLKVLLVRAKRAGADARYVINPAFAPALGIRDVA